jgi:hypothetical protein
MLDSGSQLAWAKTAVSENKNMHPNADANRVTINERTVASP